MTYYLHLLDGSRLHIGSVIAICEDGDLPTIATGLVSDGKSCCMDRSWTLGPVKSRNEAVGIAMAIAGRYNWDVQVDGQPMRLPYKYIDLRLAAATVGAAGGSSTSEAKRQASRENGKKGGRPKRTDA